MISKMVFSCMRVSMSWIYKVDLESFLWIGSSNPPRNVHKNLRPRNGIIFGTGFKAGSSSCANTVFGRRNHASMRNEAETFLNVCELWPLLGWLVWGIKSLQDLAVVVWFFPRHIQRFFASDCWGFVIVRLVINIFTTLLIKMKINLSRNVHFYNM